MRVLLQMPSGLSRLRIHQLGAYGALLGYQKSSSAVFLDMLVVRRSVSFEFPSTLYRICSGIYRRDKILTRVRTPGTHHGPTQRFSAHDELVGVVGVLPTCLLYTSPSPRDGLLSRMPSSA